MQANQTDCRFLTIWEVRIHGLEKFRPSESYPSQWRFGGGRDRPRRNCDRCDSRGRLAIGRARVRKLEIDELIVGRLRVTEKFRAPPTPGRQNPTVLTSGQVPLERRPEIHRDLPISDARILNLATTDLYAER